MAPTQPRAFEPGALHFAQTTQPSDLRTNIYNPYLVKHRRRTTKDQLLLLEGTFKTTPKPSSEARKALALRLNMTAREVQIWFQNRRAKQKNMVLKASSASPDATDAGAAPACRAELDAALVSALLPERVVRASASARAGSLETDRSPAVMRRHSDVPPALVHAATAGGQPRATATAAAAGCYPPTALGEGASSTAASAGPMGPLAMYAPPAQKKKRAGATDRFDTARVHYEAFDGTNKLPLKPDDYMGRSTDDQASLQDPANLPFFLGPAPAPMLPTPGLGAPMALGPPPFPPPVPCSWPGGAPVSQQHPPLSPADFAALFSGLFSQPAAAPGLALNTLGLSAMGGPGAPSSAPLSTMPFSPADLYAPLALLTAPGAGAATGPPPPLLHSPPRTAAVRTGSLATGVVSPLSPAAVHPPPCPSSVPQLVGVDGALVSPVASAFAAPPYEPNAAAGQPKNAAPLFLAPPFGSLGQAPVSSAPSDGFTEASSSTHPHMY
ncbi:hypothetical protein GGI07_002420 [Coemansia sp. Benny D115]|nr:hypothetical protein GGI07_002420 [Coemansia sp. Benny D115]